MDPGEAVGSLVFRPDVEEEEKALHVLLCLYTQTGGSQGPQQPECHLALPASSPGPTKIR